MKNLILITIITFCTLSTTAQNLFPVKLNNCSTERFCLDCGDEKAGADKAKFEMLIRDLNLKNNLNRMQGKIMVQVLVDAKGNGCVLSHSDQYKTKITKKIIKALNKFDSWTPAKSEGKIEEMTSINLSFTIQNSLLSGKIERVNMTAFKQGLNKPKSPEIFNKTYNYTNENLSNYDITVWNSKNSNLSNNMNDDLTVDKNNQIWLTIDKGLMKFDGETFKNAEQNIVDKGSYFNYFALATDNNDVKWCFASKGIYSFDNEKWRLHTVEETGIDGAYRIINNKESGELFFCSDEGLTIYKDEKWSNLNQKEIPELPSNRVTFAKRDSKNRLWIGTFSGSVMVDKNGKATSFNQTKTVLNGKCITSMDEDENGNLYFSLYEFDRKNKETVNNDEGIAIYSTSGKVTQLTTDNSGMPFNHVTKVLYDKNEKILWIATDRAGLVRYDLNGGWENYHTDNSKIPSCYISDMTFDNNGILYLGTRQGLVRIKRK